jgi:hypothetical protein
MFPTEFVLNLLRHPATPAPVVRSIEVHAARTVGGGLEFAYCLRGDMARLLIPALQKAGCADRLWEHSCFEAFVGVLGEPAYHEFNFSPSGQWAAYAFSGYRQRDEALRLLVPPQITARLSVGRLELAAEIPASVLPPMAGVATLQVGLAAVIEAIDTVDGSHSYWALRHPAVLPDFHHRASFALELAVPRELA